MRPDDLSDLRERALLLIERGQHDQAATTCLELAARDAAGAGNWARRAADCHRRAGRRKEEIEALLVSVDAFRQQGFFVKAIAVCKAILAIEPSHAGAQRRLSELYVCVGTRSVPPKSPPSLKPPASVSQIANMALAEIVPGSKRSPSLLPSEPPVYVIPIEELEFVEADTIVPPRAGAEDGADAQRVVFPRTPLFSDLSPPHLARLMDRSQVKHFQAGAIVCRQGEFSDDLYVVVDGSVEVSLERPQAVVLATLGEGEFFGEVALLTSGARSATVRTREDSELLVIAHGVVRELIEHEPNVLVVVLRFLRERLLRQLVARNPLFEPFASDAAKFQLLEIELGNTLIRQGEEAKGLFVLMAGSAQALLKDERGEHPVGDLRAGDLCGEMSLLSGAPAVASVRASTKCLALFLSEKDFREAMMVHAHLLDLVSKLAEARRAKNEQVARGRQRYTEERLPIV